MCRLRYVAVTALLWFFLFSNSRGGSTCPPFQDILPCYCTDRSQGSGTTTMVCAGIKDSQQLQKATKGMKGLMVDRFLILNSFREEQSNENITENNVNDVDPESNGRERLPARWLSGLRVKELEIQDSSLSSCFLCDEPFCGQSDFLIGVSATHSSLDGHLCNTCNKQTKAVSLRELNKVLQLQYLDLSWNDIEVIDGMAFPTGLVHLKKVDLSNNKITTIHDNAFTALTHVTDLNLSNNRLTAFTRRAFRAGCNVQILDLSWNSLQAFPEGLFEFMRNLKELKIGYNHIEVLPSNTWARLPANIEKLDFKGNFLVCNCSMSWVSQLLGRSTRVNGRCAYPPDVESQELKSLTSLRTCP